MRAFIALELPDKFVHETAALARTLEHAVAGRFLKRDTYHITLAFLGDVGKDDADRAAHAIEAAAESASSIPLRCTGLGKFGKPSDATLWLGVVESPEIMELCAAVRNELAARDVSFDSKRFRPHITLARHARLPRGAMPNLPFPGNSNATRVTLFKSTLEPNGAVYKPLYTAELS